MKSVYKYHLQLGPNAIDMPVVSEILTAQIQEGSLVLWALVEKSEITTTRWFKVAGTGHDLPSQENLKYISTCQTGPYVWHIFEVLRGY